MKNTTMKNSFFMMLWTLVFVTLSNLSIAQPIKQDITGVNRVELNLACEVILLQGDKSSLVISGDNEDLEDVKVRISGNKLEVNNKRHHQHKEDIKINLTVTDLNELSLSGVVDIQTPETVKFTDFRIEASGVAEIDFKLQSTKVNIDASGVLTARITGDTKDLDVEISGVGKLNASEFKSENCQVDVSGVAKASVYALEKLDASVSGMGRITYCGRPIINKNTSGFGSISRL